VKAQPDPTTDSGTSHEILLAAGKLFLERGYGGTSVEAIAEAVGMTPGALYWHFRSKQEILYTFLRKTIDNVVDQLIDDESAAPTERLRRLCTAHVTSQLTLMPPPAPDSTHNFIASQLITALPIEQQGELRDSQNTYLHRLTALLREGVDRGEFECEHITPTAFAIVTMCEDVNTWFRPTGNLSIEQLADLYSELAIRMVSSHNIERTET
jgi:AcrR family transcriptional regulator